MDKTNLVIEKLLEHPVTDHVVLSRSRTETHHIRFSNNSVNRENLSKLEEEVNAEVGYEGRTGRASGCHLHYGLFSPDETAVFGMEPVAAAHMLLPTEMIARVDPLPGGPPPGRFPSPSRAVPLPLPFPLLTPIPTTPSPLLPRA